MAEPYVDGGFYWVRYGSLEWDVGRFTSEVPDGCFLFTGDVTPHDVASFEVGPFIGLAPPDGDEPGVKLRARP
jgi:hypothetical protein